MSVPELSHRTVTAYLSLGSNMGDRLANLRGALRRLDRLPHTRIARVSSIYETSPVGVTDGGKFLNCAAAVRTSLTPTGLLVELKRLEAGAGRRPSARRWVSRPLDIDIVFYGRAHLRTALLAVPHPAALKRKFVLAPLAELNPRRRPSVRPGKPLRARLARLKTPAQLAAACRADRRGFARIPEEDQGGDGIGLPGAPRKM